jgi:site-specific recombinase XerD
MAVAYRPKLGSELEFVGPRSGMPVARLEVVQFEAWLPDSYRPDQPVLMGKNGRPRNLITLPGHNRGIKPRNAGKRFPPEPLTPTEALALLATIDATTMAGVRNRALLTLLWRTGLRISEALDLKPHHVDYLAKRVTVLHGKGDKRRTVGIDDGGLAAVQPWLLERAMMLQAVPERVAVAPLFCTIQLPGRGGRMHDAYVRSVLHKYGRLAGIPKRVHPHGWRHTLACDLIMEGFGITDVQAQLGHSNVATTATYLRGLGADQAFEKVAERQWPGVAS